MVPCGRERIDAVSDFSWSLVGGEPQKTRVNGVCRFFDSGLYGRSPKFLRRGIRLSVKDREGEGASSFPPITVTSRRFSGVPEDPGASQADGPDRARQ